MKVRILAGGMGTRLTEETIVVPKPMDRDRRTPDSLTYYEDLLPFLV